MLKLKQFFWKKELKQAGGFWNLISQAILIQDVLNSTKQNLTIEVLEKQAFFPFCFQLPVFFCSSVSNSPYLIGSVK